MKRVLDLILSFFALVILLPLLMVISALVVFDLGFPVIFRQARLGRKGVGFYILKFRTMVAPSADQVVGSPSDDNRRLTKVGKFLRRTSLDELPSLWNVLKGEMSLVGPRPLLAEYRDTYTDKENQRHDVLPGLTGLAQVSGRNSLTWKQKMRLDLFYAERNNFWLDLWILRKTVIVVLRGKYIDPKSRDHMPPEVKSGE